MDNGTAATSAGDRIEALDFTRGCVLFGILLMNITGMGLADAYTNPVNAGGATGANLWAWIITEIGFEGTQRAIFSMLFGAGVVLFLSHAEAAGRRDAVDLFLRRTLWLIAFGLVNAWVLLWSGDILYFYGITGLFVVAFRKLSVRALMAIGLAGLLFNAGLGALDSHRLNATRSEAAMAEAVKAAGKPLSKEQTSAIEAWQESASHFTAKPGEVAKANAEMRGGYASAWKRVADDNFWMESYFLYRYWFDIFSMMIIGMALMKAGVLTGEAPVPLYVAMLIGGYGIGLATNIAETRSIIDSGFAPAAFGRTGITYDLGRLTMATGHLGAMLLLCRSGMFSWLRRSLAAVGRMALTNYLTHSLIALIVFVGFRQFGQFQRHELYYIVFAIWAAQLILSPIWLKHFRFGPVEWLWRALTYLKAPPFRRSSALPPRLAPAE